MGITLQGTGISCDAARSEALTFLSHAGVRTRARRLIVTRETAALAGIPEERIALSPPLGEPFSLGRLTLTLLASGYLPGSAHLLVVHPGGRRTLYVSRLGGSPARAPLSLLACDVLHLAPDLADPARAGCVPGGEAALVARTVRAFGEGLVPVLLLPVPAILARVAPVLMDAGIEVEGSGPVAAASLRLRGLGIRSPDVPRTRGEPGPGRAVLVPLGPAGRLPRLPRNRLLLAVIDAGDPVPAGDVDEVLRIAHAAGLDAYADIVEASGAREVHVDAGLGVLAHGPGPAGRSIRWFAPASQETIA